MLLLFEANSSPSKARVPLQKPGSPDTKYIARLGSLVTAAIFAFSIHFQHVPPQPLPAHIPISFKTPLAVLNLKFLIRKGRKKLLYDIFKIFMNVE